MTTIYGDKRLSEQHYVCLAGFDHSFLSGWLEYSHRLQLKNGS
ncbi:hypothetical protein [Oceanobacter mangrovi]|nr:hypothetical protein [Oceanobacter mangrovi]